MRHLIRGTLSVLSFRTRSTSRVGSTAVNCLCRFQNMSTQRPKVYVTKNTKTLPEDGVKLLRQFCEVTECSSTSLIAPREELLKGVKDADAIFCILTDKIDAEVLDAAGSNLKVIGTMSVGYDHVDVKECKKRGIPVGFTPDVLTSATAELTVGLLLATSRRLSEGIRAVKEGTWGMWDPLWMCGQGLDRATVGIVGLGRIGFAVAQRLKPFGVEKILYSGNTEKSNASEIPAEFVPFDNLLERSDFVVACCALTKENMGLMNADAFKKMKKSAVFVNTTRGGLVNQTDLYNALKSGEIWGAGIDVTTPEPLLTDSPLLTLDNLVVSPHIGSATLRARNAMSELCARNIIEVLQGRPMLAQIKI